ncbi:hypothetical protein HZH66_013763 [Vespula vulgaris]|uniref:Uncharacterized protein n=1 Tax=Vespula vulgaris TaxID=7454 RepID=A0A834J437_VESVU|nr:hypothetical protein HZH66_013763 [Vespula vulgaris]
MSRKVDGEDADKKDERKRGFFVANSSTISSPIKIAVILSARRYPKRCSMEANIRSNERDVTRRTAACCFLCFLRSVRFDDS